MEPLRLIRFVERENKILKPTRSRTFAAELNGVSTEFFITYFKNNITILILQSATVGNLYSVKVEEIHRDDPSDPAYNMVPLQGSDDIEIEAAVRYIAGQLDTKTNLVVGLNLKSYDLNALKLIVEVLKSQNVICEYVNGNVL